MKKNAFTLAEVLITLGIIGIVAAMTMPTLIANYQKQVYVTTLHKFYTEISQAALHYMADKNVTNLEDAGLDSITASNNWLKSYLKIVKHCKPSTSGCFAKQYRKINGGIVCAIEPFQGYDRFVLASGLTIVTISASNGAVNLYIDINGEKGPNIAGRDLFATILYPNGILDDLNPYNSLIPPTEKIREENFQNYHINQQNIWWWGYLGKILNDNWEMNY